MYSKQVWHDRRHQLEVFVNDEGAISGVIISTKRGICLINPRPEILIALYQEAKIKRILSINAIILTQSTPEIVRGLCTFLGYSRKLRRRKALDVYVHEAGDRERSFVDSCCMQLMSHDRLFEFTIHKAKAGSPFAIGEGRLQFDLLDGGSRTLSPRLTLRTDTRRFEYYDETFVSDVIDSGEEGKPDLIVRAIQLPLARRIEEATARPVVFS